MAFRNNNNRNRNSMGGGGGNYGTGYMNMNRCANMAGSMTVWENQGNNYGMSGGMRQGGGGGGGVNQEAFNLANSLINNLLRSPNNQNSIGLMNRNGGRSRMVSSISSKIIRSSHLISNNL